MTNCKDCSLCNKIGQIELHNDVSKLLDKVQLWDDIDSEMNSNQFKKINKFECLVCFFKTLNFNDWKCHIMSVTHLVDCHKMKNLFSYVCVNKVCKLLLYGPKDSLIEHNVVTHNVDNFGVSTLMAAVMKRYVADNCNPLYYCSHCRQFAETPIHTNVTSYKKIRIPIEYYCRFCRVTFLSSQEMIDYHILSVEHMTLKCFDELCPEAKIIKKKKKKKKKLSTTNIETIKPSIIIQDIPLFKKYNIKSDQQQNVQLNESKFYIKLIILVATTHYHENY